MIELPSNFKNWIQILFYSEPCLKLYHLTLFIRGHLLNLLIFFRNFRFKIYTQSSDEKLSLKLLFTLYILHYPKTKCLSYDWLQSLASQERRACGLFAVNDNMNYTEILNYACNPCGSATTARKKETTWNSFTSVVSFGWPIGIRTTICPSRSWILGKTSSAIFFFSSPRQNGCSLYWYELCRWHTRRYLDSLAERSLNQCSSEPTACVRLRFTLHK